MNAKPDDIERIMTLVIERLRRLDTSDQPPARAPGVTSPGRSAGRTQECSISDRVVSRATLRERLDGRKPIHVRRGAVITPAALDELKRREIQVVYTDIDAHAASTRCNLRLSLWQIQYDPRSLLMELELANVVVDSGDAGDDGLRDVSQAVAQEDDIAVMMGILLTEQTCVAACRLNRESHVRAAAVYCRRTVRD